MSLDRIPRVLRPNRYLLVVVAFFVLFPVFMDLITPDVIHSYSSGTLTAQGEVIARSEGGNGPEYRWYYPLLYPFMLVWYVAILLFDVVDVLLPRNDLVYYGAQLLYFYLLAAGIVALFRRFTLLLRTIDSRHRTA